MDLFIRAHGGVRVATDDVEIVERKGIGHPDTICDAIAEHVSVRLSRHYLERFGVVLHHNVDKVLLCGGAARPAFGGGEVTEPIEIYLAGRATESHAGERIPVHDIATEACKEWIVEHLRGLNAERDVRIVSKLRPGSVELQDLFGQSGVVALANDTSCGAGFAPFTDLENVVLEVERSLNSRTTKDREPAIGEDIKVMGVRRRSRIDLTIACALVGRYVRNTSEYVAKRDIVRQIAIESARRVTSLPVEVRVNAADDPERGSVYLTVTGTSAEAGDDGEVGRGNRACGLITPYRPMTLEAAAGKNSVTHVGKLYNVLAQRIARALVENIDPIAAADCILLSQIGSPVARPQLVDVRLALDPGVDIGSVRAAVNESCLSQLEALPELRQELIAERVPLY